MHWYQFCTKLGGYNFFMFKVRKPKEPNKWYYSSNNPKTDL